jgi:flagellar hook-basal body complex protein FliE
MSVLPVSPVVVPDASMQVAPVPLASAPSSTVPFSQLLVNGIQDANNKAITADNTVRAFILDDSVPVHQVSYALAQAKMSLELMLQVRSRLAEGYQQLMNMQL